MRWSVCNLQNVVNDIKSHEWFNQTEWMALYQRQIVAPIVPKSRDPEETAGEQEYKQLQLQLQLQLLQLEAQPLFDKEFEDF